MFGWLYELYQTL